MSSAIPIIDFADWNANTSAAHRRAVADKLVEACRDVGFVYIVNHGVSPESLEQAFGWAKKLFDLPQEDKMKAPHPNGHYVHRGYSWPGLEKVSQVYSAEEDPDIQKKLRAVTDCKESYEIGSEDNDDQPNVWLPEDVLPGFRAFTTQFYWECNKTAVEILKALSLGLGLQDEDYLLKFHSGKNNQLRLLHYPPVPASALESEAMARMPAHSDWGSITMLFQDDCGGLEVQSPTGEFVKAEPIKNAIVMNIGDLLMRWSNDVLKSTLHRVTLPPLSDRFSGPDRMTRARYSIPYFISPDTSATIECLPACTGADNPPKYAPINQSEYRAMRASVQYEVRPAEVGVGA